MTMTYHAPSAPPRIDADPTPAPAATPRADRLAGWALKGPLTAAIVATCGAQWLAWAPQYLTWPWFADHDVFASLARSWDAGLRPYRDVRCNNFPGTIYLHWALGHAFGWGRTVPFFALDAGLLLPFGALMLAWSRRRFAGLLPGAIGLAAALSYYFGLDYSQVAQRDWHAALLATSALLAVQTWPDRRGRWLAAGAFALALSIRPQAVLFLPAMASALGEGPAARGESPGRAVRGMLGWSLLLAACVALAFLPLALAGVLGDLVRGVRLASYGSRYCTVTAGSFLKELTLPLLALKNVVVPLLIGLLMPAAGPGGRRVARTWLLALLGTLIYRPISPQSHAYLAHPMMLTWAINLAVLAHLLRKAPGLTPSARLAALLLVLALGATLRPRFCNPQASLAALPLLARGAEPAVCPVGYTANAGAAMAARYEWPDYVAALTYLRHSVPPGTRVANALKGLPALTGPAGRLSAFPAEAVAWLRMVAPGDEADFAAALERTPDSVVVWSPAEVGTDPDFPLDVLTPAIRRLYRPEARFGAIEVWRRAPEETSR